MLGVAAAFLCVGDTHAGAWPMGKGRTQAIAKYEARRASEAFGGVLIGGDRQDVDVSFFVEHGLTERLTLQGRGGVTRGHDDAARYRGRGPLELGLRYAVLKRERSVASVSFSVVEGGEGRNAGYAAPGAGTMDLEGRILIGRSANIGRNEVFVDMQLARLRRRGLDDETRLDATLGVRPAPGWLVMTQTYAGQTDSEAFAARWLKGEASVVRSFGQFGVQVGWRQTLAGRGVAKDKGPVIAVWRGF